MAEWTPFVTEVVNAVYSGYGDRDGYSFDADGAADAVLALIPAHDAEVRAKALEDAAGAVPWLDPEIADGIIDWLRARAAAERDEA